MKIINIKNIQISNFNSLIAVPIMGKNENQILEDILYAIEQKAELIEWRCDYFLFNSLNEILDILNNIKNILISTPLIFTLRDKNEGGYNFIEDNMRLEILRYVIKSGLVDIIDIELNSFAKEKNEIIELAHKNNTFVIISNHNFKKTPTYNQIISILYKMKDYNADILKIAYMPLTKKDVLSLLNANFEFINKEDILTICISMGKLGLISRITSNFFGSCITFARNKEESAPGQISVKDLKAYLDVIN